MAGFGRELPQPKKILGLEVYNYPNIPDLYFDGLEYDRKKREGKTRKKIVYARQFLTFDIETTTYNKDLNIMYVWMVCYNNDFVIIGRTWEQYQSFVQEVKAAAGDMRVLVFVHNLSYEFQYIRGLTHFSPSDVFVIDSRKVLKAMDEGIEYRCSYRLTNLSLEHLTKKFHVEHKKLSGEDFDYTVHRTPSTPLTDSEIGYCVSDVKGLAECIIAQNEFNGDTWYTMPLTQTGYIRRECKDALKKTVHQQRKLFPYFDLYKMLRKAFRGGNTHANRYFTGQILGEVWSYDIQSSYPAVMLLKKFPMTPFHREENLGLYYFNRLCKNKNKAFLVEICLENVRLKDESWGFPYISLAKVSCGPTRVIDNGRILSADYIEMIVTDIDYNIISSEYNYTISSIKRLYTSDYKKLPKQLRDVVKKYYNDKTRLKGVEGQEVFYQNAKEKVNSVYGMTAQDPLKDTIEYLEGDPDVYKPADTDPYDLLDNYHKHGWLPYQWGVWVTAWARHQLEIGLRHAGEFAVYCDTDSVKVLHPVDFAPVNDTIISRCDSSGAYAYDSKGSCQYMGIFDFDGHYQKFVTFGAKKYCYEKDGEPYITISGVGKVKGGKEIKAAGGIKALKPGFVFSSAGGMEATYNDGPTSKIMINGEEVTVTPNIALTPSTYTLLLSKSYRQLLDGIFSAKYKKPIDFI